MRVAPIPEMRIIRCSLRGPRWSRVVVAAERSARSRGLFEGGANSLLDVLCDQLFTLVRVGCSSLA
jgi:hypothetical protein